jgi:flagellar biosynthesis GTPase FlhF
MLQPQRTMLRTAVSATFLLLAASLLGQGKFKSNGRVKIEGGDIAGARAVVYKNGVKERTITTGLGKFALELDLNASYIVSFEKDGYVAKKISFDTRVPADAIANGFTPFDFAVSLFKQYDDINMVVFNQPVGMIRYDGSAGDFDYDTDYTKSIQSQLQEAVAQVEKKQKQEAAGSAEAEKRKAEEAKVQQKAEVEARKQAAAQEAAAAKAKAEAEKAAAAEAKAKEESDRRTAAEAEKRKAEEARAVAAQKETVKPPVANADPKAEATPKAPAESKPERPKPIPSAPAPQRNTLAAAPSQGADGRRRVEPVLAEEPSRVAKARTIEQQEGRPAPRAVEADLFRTEELIVESGKVTTVVRVEVGGKATEYRRVYHKWGGVFYFKDGQACTQLVYESEALSPQDQLAGATPRGKLD